MKNDKSVKDQVKDFFDNPLTAEDTVILMNGKNSKTFMKFIEKQKAKLMLERMGQLGEDKEYVFAIRALGELQEDLKKIFPAMKKFKEKVKEEEEKKANKK